MFPSENDHRADHHAAKLSGDRRDRRSCDFQARSAEQSEDQDRIQNDVDHCAGQAADHRSDHVSGRLQDLFKYDLHIQKKRADADDLHIDRRLFINIASFFGITGNKNTGKTYTDNQKYQIIEDSDPKSRARCLIGLGLPVRAETSCDQGVDPHTAADRKRDDQHLHRIDDGYRRQSVFAEFRYENTVYDIIERADSHRQDRRPGHTQKQRPDRKHAHLVFLRSFRLHSFRLRGRVGLFHFFHAIPPRHQFV